MSLKNQLTQDMKQAMRDRDTVKLGTIRFLMSAIKNFEIDHGEQDDAGVEKIVAQQLKQMKEAIEEYKKGGREDLVSEEEAKVRVLQGYLPEQMSDDELEKIIRDVMTGMDGAQMGPVIGAVKAKVGNQADGGKIAGMVKQVMG